MTICLILAAWLLLGLISLSVTNKLLKKANANIRSYDEMVVCIYEKLQPMTPEFSTEFLYSVVLTTKLGYLLGCILWPIAAPIMIPPLVSYIKHTKGDSQ